MRTLRWLLGLTLLLGGCSVTPPSPPAPTIVCRIADDDCERGLLSAMALLERESLGTPTRIVVLGGSARTFHAEVHACFADGRYVLIDAIGPIAFAESFDPATTDVLKEASIRADPWDDPPCD